jgi:hypothetical protein
MAEHNVYRADPIGRSGVLVQCRAPGIAMYQSQERRRCTLRMAAGKRHKQQAKTRHG